MRPVKIILLTLMSCFWGIFSQLSRKLNLTQNVFLTFQKINSKFTRKAKIILHEAAKYQGNTLFLRDWYTDICHIFLLITVDLSLEQIAWYLKTFPQKCNSDVRKYKIPFYVSQLFISPNWPGGEKQKKRPPLC